MKENCYWYEHSNATTELSDDGLEDYVYTVKRKHLEDLLAGKVKAIIFDARMYNKKDLGDVFVEVEKE